MKRFLVIFLLIGFGCSAHALVRDTLHYADGTRVYPDSAIYQGMSIKLDLANSIIEAATSKGKIQNYEIAMNWRLKNRFYPTLELGYAMADCGAAGGHHNGQGGFTRVGLDINGLRKGLKKQSALLIGVRVGTAVQQFQLTNVTLNDLNAPDATIDFPEKWRADCWGEVVVGCQVQIYAGFLMGWAARMKFMFTNSDKHFGPLPYYVPGFGYRDGTNWGLNYYIGYKF